MALADLQNGDFDRMGGIEVYKPADLEEDNTE